MGQNRAAANFTSATQARQFSAIASNKRQLSAKARVFLGRDREIRRRAPALSYGREAIDVIFPIRTRDSMRGSLARLWTWRLSYDR